MPAEDVLVLGGPNGAGKATASRVILPESGLTEFVNADIIARDLSTCDLEAAASTAGRIMIERMRALAAEGQSFVFETTPASRTFVPFLRGLKTEGYNVHVFYLWPPSAEESIRHVMHRVQLGGHHVPADDIRRRSERGPRNFFTLYMPIATSWRLYDSSTRELPRIASGGIGLPDEISQPDRRRMIHDKVRER